MCLFRVLPIEIVEHVVGCLALKEAENIRLLCRSIQDNASDGRSKTFTTKQVDQRMSNLDDFAEYIKPGTLPCLLENLTINRALNVTKSLGKVFRLRVILEELPDPMTGRLQFERGSFRRRDEHDRPVLLGISYAHEIFSLPLGRLLLLEILQCSIDRS